VGDVHLVAMDDPGVNAALDPVHDELPATLLAEQEWIVRRWCAPSRRR
jgi:hypothetical protein